VVPHFIILFADEPLDLDLVLVFLDVFDFEELVVLLRRPFDEGLFSS